MTVSRVERMSSETSFNFLMATFHFEKVSYKSCLKNSCNKLQS